MTLKLISLYSRLYKGSSFGNVVILRIFSIACYKDSQ